MRNHPQRGGYEVERLAFLVADQCALATAAGAGALCGRDFVTLHYARQVRGQRPATVPLALRQFGSWKLAPRHDHLGHGRRRRWLLLIDPLEQQQELLFAHLLRCLLLMAPQNARQLNCQGMQLQRIIPADRLQAISTSLAIYRAAGVKVLCTDRVEIGNSD